MLETIGTQIAALHDDESGATATEYIILLILVACFVIGIVKVFGGTLSQKMTDADDAVTTLVTF